ncbi:TrpB-like pyridoxal phosphate-dependent enzyme [Pseudonocardia sp.]|uniref:TrpB-like pyridoxal phosphate-dependent enzyme n=1 Tax=Pseudonocardia sp. TaxID=60912 RepID=UPI00260FDA81|nr:TrpB-like pyridoxal phosphate-dependent enzyme [Pseudonocardia sp.]
MTRWTLPPDKIPGAWFNVVPHLSAPPQPPLHPGTREPVGPDDLAPLFPMALIGQEVSAEPWIDVPGEVLDILRLWRPTPLVRATRLEKALGTPARIYFKDESISPSGSHKTNTAVPQAFYNAQEGITCLTTETGAGQWGTALAFATAQFDLDLKVYMVRASYEQKPYRRIAIETWGGEVVASPVDDPGHPGSLGSAISDAVRDCAGRADTHYSLGSVLNHVLLHQTVIGLEAREQLELAGERLPDVVIAPCGGGSNLGGIAFPFVPDAGVRLLAVEPLSCPTLTQGEFGYDFGDVQGLTPLLPMYSLGREFVPPSIHAGGLRYHGDSPLISQLVRDGRMEAVAYPQGKVFEAAIQFARTEGKIPAPECAHGIRAAIDEALAAKETGEEKVILFNYCGHGFLDLSAYDDHNNGRLPEEQGS